MSVKYTNRVRERLSFYSVHQTELCDLFAILIGEKTATPELCSKLAGIGLEELSEMSLEELSTLVHKPAAERIYVAFELGFRAMRAIQESNSGQHTIIRSPQDAFNLVRYDIAHKKQEHFVVLLMNSKNHLIGKETVFIGSLNNCVIHPRETFKIAIKKSASGIICLHNHPSGDPTPSPEDIDVTNRFKEAGEIVGIKMIDHIIVGKQSFYSMKQNEMM